MLVPVFANQQLTACDLVHDGRVPDRTSSSPRLQSVDRVRSKEELKRDEIRLNRHRAFGFWLDMVSIKTHSASLLSFLWTSPAGTAFFRITLQLAGVSSSLTQMPSGVI